MSLFFFEFWERLGAPEPLSVAALPLGVFLLLAASGLVPGSKYGAFSLPSPGGKRQKIAWRMVGTVLIDFSVAF